MLGGIETEEFATVRKSNDYGEGAEILILPRTLDQTWARSVLGSESICINSELTGGMVLNEPSGHVQQHKKPSSSSAG
jgi:hypothetical protein